MAIGMEQSVHVELGPRSYEIVVERGLLARLGREVAQRVVGAAPSGRQVVILTQPKIEKFYGRAVRQSLENAGFRVQTVALPAGERFKTLGIVQKAYRALLEMSADRRTIIVALGGGVIGDLAGFVAASYNRGLDFVQVPTTLLAQVDSSVGGKVGVNFGAGKNLIGAFYQPRFVAVDPETLKSLSPRERRSGFAEVIKYGIIDDKPFFEQLGRDAEDLLSLKSEALASVIAHSCRVKARVVEADEHEGGLRAILNYGHTIGHALEGVTHYRMFTHGEAIALGMVSAALIGEEVGLTKSQDTMELIRVFQRFGFAVQLDGKISIEAVCTLLSLDKKSIDGEARFVLMERIGHVSPGHAVPLGAVRRALERQQTLSYE